MDERRQTSPLLNEQQLREFSRKQAFGLIETFIDPLQSRGFYGKVPLELELRDGLVTVVRATGNEETMVVPPPQPLKRRAA